MRCLRKIVNIKWQEHVTNTVVLQKCGTVGIEAIIIASQLRWVGHIARIPDKRIQNRFSMVSCHLVQWYISYEIYFSFSFSFS